MAVTDSFSIVTQVSRNIRKRLLLTLCAVTRYFYYYAFSRSYKALLSWIDSNYRSLKGSLLFGIRINQLCPHQLTCLVVMVTRKEMSIRASEAAVWAFNLGWWFEVAETPLCFGTGFVLEWKIRNQRMEEGSERISTPIRSPSEKDSIILNRTSASSSPFGFRKVNARILDL